MRPSMRPNRTMDDYREEETYLINKLADPVTSSGEKMGMCKKLKLIQKEMKELDSSYVPEHELSEL